MFFHTWILWERLEGEIRYGTAIVFFLPFSQKECCFKFKRCFFFASKKDATAPWEWFVIDTLFTVDSGLINSTQGFAWKAAVLPGFCSNCMSYRVSGIAKGFLWRLGRIDLIHWFFIRWIECLIAWMLAVPSILTHKISCRELTYPVPRHVLNMIFLFLRGASWFQCPGTGTVSSLGWWHCATSTAGRFGFLGGGISEVSWVWGKIEGLCMSVESTWIMCNCRYIYISIAIGSMYDMFAYIWLFFVV